MLLQLQRTGSCLEFFQDRVMQQIFANYPELLLMDATYKLNELRMPVYLLLAVNGNSENEFVGSFLGNFNSFYKFR